jgi:hypothetical protein
MGGEELQTELHCWFSWLWEMDRNTQLVLGLGVAKGFIRPGG